MLVRALALVGCLLLGGLAHAQTSPIVVIEPFESRCFDADKLAERLRDELPSSSVRKTAPRAAHRVVRVRDEGTRIVVEVSERGGGKPGGSETRAVPVDAGCDAALRAVALIVARAVLPLHGLPAPRSPHPTPVEHPREPPAIESKPPVETRPPRVEEPKPPVETRPTTTAQREPENTPPAPTPTTTPPRPSPPAKRAEAPPPKRVETPAPPKAVDNGAVVRRPPRPPLRRRFELDAAAYWAFPISGPSSAPGGELSLGHTWRRGLGVDVGAGVEGSSTASLPSSAGTVSVSTRRVPLRAELHVDVRIPSGSIRFAAGPLVALWLTSSGGLPQPASQLLVEPGVTARVGYRLDLGRFALGLGVVADVSLMPHDLAIGGAGTVVSTPWLTLSPELSAGVQFF